MSKSRSRAYNRDVSYRKACRKKRISDMWYTSWWPDFHYYNNLHQYSKNKIHCSCGMCSRYTKTNNKGKHRRIHGNYAPSYNPPMHDLRRIAQMDAEEANFWDTAALTSELTEDEFSSWNFLTQFRHI